jgi:formiminotetrahydrofolate cyclodeaminase
MSYLDGKLREYVDALASGKPTPGGGSAAALVGALGAALNSMVANFTVGREKYAAVEAEVQALLAESEALRAELQGLAQADTEAYGTVSAAYRLPKGTEAEKAARTAAIQEALKVAARVPLSATRACHRVLEIAADLVDQGNPNLITDVGVAAKFALAALECAVLNAEINLRGLQDEAYVSETLEELRPLVRASEQLGREVWDKVIQTMRKAR